ncbi:MAG TPA: 4'-phosphopantetheinyl transferase superfamily protein [Gemmatimonadales bacterium]|jgi:hypothetical protein
MMPCRQVAPGVWLGFARCPPAGHGIAPARLWARDREAADRAVTAVLNASGYRRGDCVTSRSHTRGVGAAIVAPANARVGIDLVDMIRVNRRHAEAILNSEEWEVLAPYAAVRPALAWALKEAAAKALGNPLQYFPHGLRIALGTCGYTRTIVEGATMEFAAAWGLLDGFLYAWVRWPSPRFGSSALNSASIDR